MLSTYNHHYQSWVFRAFWRRANIQTVSSRNSLQWPTYIMYLLIKRRKLFIQNVLRFRILRHQNLADLISLTWYDSQSKKASLYNYLKIFFHSQAPHRFYLRLFLNESLSPFHSFTFFYRFVRPWSLSSLFFSFSFFFQSHVVQLVCSEIVICLSCFPLFINGKFR